MKSYSFSNVIALVNGVELSGYSEGDDVVVAERLVDSAFPAVSVDGVMTVSLSADHSGTIVIKLKQNSESNAYLTGLLTAQENGVFVPIFIQVINTEGGEVISGTQGFMQNPALLQFGQQLQESEWTFVVERLDLINLGAAA